ncbi:DUF7793 family protein [Botryobacter ruber]|uniref:DUF7793 family protein n=1 Tax=Botryobacter ruber TaxID=2171629 RepID=UPI000E0CA3B0|nr:hypothetical protein [Botryobacter ruber]
MEDNGKKNTVKSKETKYSITFIENDIAQCIYKEIEEVDLNNAKINVKDRVEFFDGVAYPCLFDITKIKHSTKEARDYLANEGSELIVASAIVVNSPVIKMMANFYITVNKPQIPTRMFTDRESAMEWLSQFKKKA